MEDDVLQRLGKCQNVSSSVRRKYRRSLRRNLNRRSRRRRSKLRYYSRLKQVRSRRNTESLCEAVTVVDITDMEWTPLVTSRTKEVADWHNREQVAYWKSRALSLEFENKMLIQHLRNVYAKQTEDYANYVKTQETIEDVPAPSETQSEPEQMVKKRREEMEKIYGEKATKIMGMEAATQLNYDLHLEDAGKLQHWPHTPLNLKFHD